MRQIMRKRTAPSLTLEHTALLLAPPGAQLKLHTHISLQALGTEMCSNASCFFFVSSSNFEFDFYFTIPGPLAKFFHYSIWRTVQIRAVHGKHFADVK